MIHIYIAWVILLLKLLKWYLESLCSSAILYTQCCSNETSGSFKFHVLLVLLHYVYYICWPMSTDVVRTCSNFACGCSLAHEDVYIHRTEFTWIFYIFESKSNISKQISRDHWYFCVARMWTEKFVIFIYLE